MSDLHCHAQVLRDDPAAIIPQIRDRLRSYQAVVEHDRTDSFRLSYPFGWLQLGWTDSDMLLEGGAPDPAGLARLKDLMATALRVYARPNPPAVVWQGSLAGDARLESFRLMRVDSTQRITPHMQRVRLSGEDLDRFAAFGAMHVRLQLPTAAVPNPFWPVAGPDGLPLWLDEARKPAPRVYTIRQLDADAGWVDIDLLLHDTDGPGADWARSVQPGDEVGMIGPVGRPLKAAADHYLLGADETGLPAIARLLETLPSHVTGDAFIEVASEAEVQPIANRTGITLHWIYREGAPAGDLLAAKVMATPFPAGNAFGWFAAEAEYATRIREYWRGSLGLGRDATLVAAYWRRGASGHMAG
ncbi:siderophore-interacting protein [Ketogulonicigenium vulgare]|uniref:siderophore-interacting protein n=1 Tax=Ketogulonicigenium vulgare TaxID=92945 RepID=UPI002358CA22|nr:siderophore-interacting protein [Ketogulonicigenium vulgare]